MLLIKCQSRVSRQSRLSAIGREIMISGAVHKTPGICLTAEENPGNPQLGDRLLKGLCDQSSPQMGSLSSKGKEGKDGSISVE